MDELLVFFLFYGGGLFAAFLFMLVATFRLQKLSRLIVCLVLAAFSLSAQGGCWHVASSIGRATGGSNPPGRDWDHFHLVTGGFIVFAVWAVTLFGVRVWRAPLPTTPPQNHASNDSYDY